MFGLVLAEMWQGLRRNTSMVISVVLVTFVSLTFIGAAILLQLQVQGMKTQWYDRAQVAVDFCTATSASNRCAGVEASGDQIAAVEEQLRGPVLAPYIRGYDFENHDQAFARFQQQFAGDPIASFVKPEYLNQAFWINLQDPSNSDVVIETLKGMPGVENVSDQRQFLDGIFQLLNAGSLSAVGVAVVMFVAAVLLIATTIRLSAFSRRREIGIMRLVGASNRFIQAPFVLEGVVAALIGAVLASAACFAIVQFFVQGYLGPRMPFTALVGLQEAWIVAPVLIVLGVLLAMVSASIAIRKYLRV